MSSIQQFDWDDFIAVLGLDHEDGGFWLSGGDVVLRGKHAGIVVDGRWRQHPILNLKQEIDYELRGTLTATFPWQGPSMSLRREGGLRSHLKQFGYQDIKVGHQALDSHLIVQGKPTEQIQQMMVESAPELASLLESDNVELPRCDGKSIGFGMTLVASKREEHFAQLVQVREVLVTMASTDFFAADILRALPGAEPLAAQGHAFGVVLRFPGKVLLRAYEAKASFGTECIATLTSARQSTSLETSEVTRIEEISGHGRLATLLTAVGSARLHWHRSELRLVWPHLVRDQETLLAGASLVARLAHAPSEGAYR